MKERKVNAKGTDLRKSTKTGIPYDNKPYARKSKILLHPITLTLALLLPLISFLIHHILRLYNVTDTKSGTTTTDELEKNTTTTTSNQRKKIENLLNWVQGNDGYINPAATLDIFPEFGGYGWKSTAEIHEHDILFRIPKSIVTSIESFKERYLTVIMPHQSTIRNNNFMTFLTHQSYNDDSQDHLIYQDWAIAMALMIECSLGNQSTFFPFLDILPNEVPRLDTFSDEELEMLQDNYLATLGRYSRATLQQIYESDVHDLVLSISESITKRSTTNLYNDKSCFTFETFHKYTSISSSRSMILYGKKYLTPLADMMNYAPRQDDKENSEQILQPTQSFLLYHHLDQEDQTTIIIEADRDVRPAHQIFEDYGPTDNTLFLEAFGFVPFHNPFHCALVQLPSPISQRTKDILLSLNLAVANPDGQIVYKDDNGACVLMDGSLSHPSAFGYLAVVALERKEGVEQIANRCWNAVNNRGISTDINFDEAANHCIYYLGHQSAVKELLREAAEKALERVVTTLDFDLSLLSRAIQNSISMSTRAVLALQFRVAEKRILTQIARETSS